MTRPNLLIIGAQKCGTTWLHSALNKSRNFWGSDPKELNTLNKPVFSAPDYEANFKNADKNSKYIYESTPHYFKMPAGKVDVAKNINDYLGDIPLILILRNPVDRYLSAYTHHMMQGRLPIREEIQEASNEYGMLELGKYHQITTHFKKYFSKIDIYLYDELLSSPTALIRDICSNLGVNCDIRARQLNFRINDKSAKAKKLSRAHSKEIILPKLSKDLERELYDYYREDTNLLASDLSLSCANWIPP